LGPPLDRRSSLVIFGAGPTALDVGPRSGKRRGLQGLGVGEPLGGPQGRGGGVWVSKAARSRAALSRRGPLPTTLSSVFSELTDIPYGPCRNFYVVDNDSRRERKKRERMEKKAARLCRRRPLVDDSDDDDDDDDDAKRARPDFVDPATGEIDYSAVRAAVTSAKPLLTTADDWMSSSKSKRTRRPSVLAALTSKLVGHPSPHRRVRLVPERRIKSVADREEGAAVQYLCLGGYRHYCCRLGEARCNGCPGKNLKRIGSALHAGAGQQTFGWDKSQRADLLLHFVDEKTGVSTLHYHNHHEMGVHYAGHAGGCWRAGGLAYSEHVATRRADNFKIGLAKALTAVRPDRVRFFYSVTTACDLFHGTDHMPDVGSTLEGRGTQYATAVDACRAERESDFFWTPTADSQKELDLETEVLPGIANGSLTGFVTVKGGREGQWAGRSPASARFGFCVQKYAPRPEQISAFTKRQVADYLGLESEEEVNRYLRRQAPRTVNSGTFHSWETVTTSYLRWLMNERRFSGFRVRHLILYKFGDDPRHFLEPILQRRHDAKKAGNSVEAECLKLVGNGSFGYNGLEATNYTRVRLMREDTYRRERYRSLAHESLKHTTMLALVRRKLKKKKGDRRKKKRERPSSAFVSAEEARGVDDDDDDDDDDEDNDDERLEEREFNAVLGVQGDDDDDDDDDDEGGGEEEKSDGGVDDEAVERQSARIFGKNPSRIGLSPLYAVETSGSKRALFNNLPKAVAVLGNSKRVFFSHLQTMLDCLDPALAELCYIDTDSCLWSLSHPRLEDCLLADKRSLWERKNIVADESGAASCHGKLKLEGTYSAALFKTSKIYRLLDEESAAVYTRAKGVNRHQALRLENRHFDANWNSAVVVHRTSLRPRKTGEIWMATEAKKLSVPFNLKRHVAADGIHTLPFSELEGPLSSSSSSSAAGESSSSAEESDDDRDPEHGGSGTRLWLDRETEVVEDEDQAVVDSDDDDDDDDDR